MDIDILSSLPTALNYIIRIIIAALCGFIIGFERKTRSKEAGIRTHTIVALGACLIMIISKYAFWDVISTGYDSARVAAQIVSGIGFLGAGMIVYSKGTLRGLTTAAGIWATAGVGMAIGAGGNIMLTVGIVTTLIIILIHLFLHLPIKMFSTREHHIINIQFEFEDNAVEKIKKIFNTENVLGMGIKTVDGKKIGTIVLNTFYALKDNNWDKILDENKFIISMVCSEEDW